MGEEKVERERERERGVLLRVTKSGAFTHSEGIYVLGPTAKGGRDPTR